MQVVQQLVEHDEGHHVARDGGLVEHRVDAHAARIGIVAAQAQAAPRAGGGPAPAHGHALAFLPLATQVRAQHLGGDGLKVMVSTAPVHLRWCRPRQRESLLDMFVDHAASARGATTRDAPTRHGFAHIVGGIAEQHMQAQLDGPGRACADAAQGERRLARARPRQAHGRLEPRRKVAQPGVPLGLIASGGVHGRAA